MYILTSPDAVNEFFATIAKADDYCLADIVELWNVITSEELLQFENTCIYDTEV